MSHDEFWNRAEAVNAGMLDVTGGTRLVPMSHYADREARKLWFITARGTQVVDAVEAGARECRYVLSDSRKGLYAHITGSLAMVNDRDKLRKLWNPVADAWFEGGLTDPDLRLLAFALTGGEVWLTPTSGIRFMFDIAKAQLSGDPPDAGEHFLL